MALKWLGKDVTAKLRAAQAVGINQTMAASVARAKRNHDWQNRTATLEGAIDIVDYAAPQERSGVKGTWGVRDVAYAFIHELGGTIKAKGAKALHFVVGGEHVVVKQVTIPARPYLRPAADAEYPKLAQRIKRAYQKAGKQQGGEA